MAGDPERSLQLCVREAEMDENEGRTNLQATPNVLERCNPLVVRNEVEGRNGCGSIEWTFWCLVDIPLVQLMRAAYGPITCSASRSMAERGSTPSNDHLGWASASALSSCPPPAPGMSTRPFGGVRSASKSDTIR